MRRPWSSGAPLTTMTGDFSAYAWAMGLTMFSAPAPYVVGGLTESSGFPAALSVAAAAYALAAVFWVGIPETKGREIQ